MVLSGISFPTRSYLQTGESGCPLPHSALTPAPLRSAPPSPRLSSPITEHHRDPVRARHLGTAGLQRDRDTDEPSQPSTAQNTKTPRTTDACRVPASPGSPNLRGRGAWIPRAGTQAKSTGQSPNLPSCINHGARLANEDPSLFRGAWPNPPIQNQIREALSIARSADSQTKKIKQRRSPGRVTALRVYCHWSRREPVPFLRRRVRPAESGGGEGLVSWETRPGSPVSWDSLPPSLSSMPVCFVDVHISTAAAGVPLVLTC